MKEAKKKYYNDGDARQEWMKLLRKFEPTTGLPRQDYARNLLRAS